MIHKFESLSKARVVFQALQRDGRGRILLFVAVGWVLSLGIRQTFPVLFPHLEAAFGLDLATLGFLYTLLWLAYALGQFPGGILGDRIGEGNILVISSALSGIAILLVVLSFSVVTLVVGMICLGLATALYGPTRFTILTDIYSDYDGTAIGITQSAGHIGNATMPVIAGVLAAYLSWQAGLYYTIPLFFFVAAGFVIFVPRRTSQTKAAIDDLSLETWQYVFRNALEPLPLFLTSILALCMFSFQAITGFYPTYLIEVKGVSPSTASLLFGLFFTSAIIIQPLAGAAGDMLNMRTVLLVIITAQAVAPVVLTVSDGVFQLVLVSVVLGAFFATGPVIIPMLTRILPADMKGAGIGLIRSGYFLFAATGSMVIGILADGGLFLEGFLSLAIPPAIALLIVIQYGNTFELAN